MGRSMLRKNRVHPDATAYEIEILQQNSFGTELHRIIYTGDTHTIPYVHSLWYLTLSIAERVTTGRSAYLTAAEVSIYQISHCSGRDSVLAVYFDAYVSSSLPCSSPDVAVSFFRYLRKPGYTVSWSRPLDNIPGLYMVGVQRQ